MSGQDHCEFGRALVQPRVLLWMTQPMQEVLHLVREDAVESRLPGPKDVTVHVDHDALVGIR